MTFNFVKPAVDSSLSSPYNPFYYWSLLSSFCSLSLSLSLFHLDITTTHVMTVSSTANEKKSHHAHAAANAIVEDEHDEGDKPSAVYNASTNTAQLGSSSSPSIGSSSSSSGLPGHSPKDSSSVDCSVSTSPSASSSTPQSIPEAKAASTAAAATASVTHHRRDVYSTVATFVSGGVAGAASRTLTAPLDRIKIIVQEGYLVQAPPGTTLSSSKNARLVDVARMIAADGGWKSFWRGNIINCFKAGPEFAIVFSLRRVFFAMYEDGVETEQRRMKQLVARRMEQRSEEEQATLGEGEDRGVAGAASTPSTEVADAKLKELRQMELESSVLPSPLSRYGTLSAVPRLAVNCTIGAAAGLGAQSVLYPMEVIKTRIVVSKSGEFKGGVREVVQMAYRAGGIREFYGGFVPNMVGIVVYRGLEMGIYSSMQQSLMLYRMQWQDKSRHDAALSTAEVGCIGMFASTIAQTVSYPLNVVRTRLQTQGANGRAHAYNGMVDCIVKMVRHKGVRSLFSGLMANYLKAVPASTCTFMVFEKMQQILLGDDD